ncbi:GntR family transcriptional regulator / MocR family aminotransferase [Hathewaya proteolytica DSM 3090]|uniref:GntR family transcriptional regulator / MocR family aminotransferase n=1 Tax=Hathewaya proteolytica DSM 3090 TaxID=1121331 RepID=A0A1M6PWR0_9CLOT|nr:PLP-dependent aminotransferase family protein [Hathewaya proteolytica]SHK12360.1 GntR family transcriptional regulator / MocR family aminotransferase [Hathewaya proteolytica DSM 3090]
MLTYYLEQRGSMAIYEYIYQCIKEDIISGRIRPSQKLPSKRAFAAHHDISIITVENAYGQLCDEGYITSIEKKGYFVNDIFSEALELKQNLSTNIQEKSSDFLCNLKNPCTEDIEINLARNGSPTSIFPFNKWAHFLRKNIEFQFEDVPFCGTLRLRTAISDYLFQFRRMKVNPTNIVIGAGAEYLYQLLMLLFGKESSYGVEDPCYDKIRKIYELGGAKTIAIPIDKDGMSVSKLNETIANIAHISPSHHFPIGISMPIKRRLEFLSWANTDTHRYIIEDEYATEFQYSMKPLASLQSMDVNSKVIYMNTFSKTISTSLRIGYMVLPNDLMERLTSLAGFYSCTVSTLEQNTLAEFIESGSYESHINKLKKHYKQKRLDLLQSLENSPYNHKFRIIDFSSGTTFLIKLKTTQSDDSVLSMAHKNNINLCFLSRYYAKKNFNSHCFIVNYSLYENDIIMKALNTIFKFLK